MTNTQSYTVTAPRPNAVLMFRVTVRSYEDGETWTEDYLTRPDAERAVESAEENGNAASYRRVYV